MVGKNDVLDFIGYHPAKKICATCVEVIFAFSISLESLEYPLVIVVTNWFPVLVLNSVLGISTTTNSKKAACGKSFGCRCCLSLAPMCKHWLQLLAKMYISMTMCGQEQSYQSKSYIFHSQESPVTVERLVCGSIALSLKWLRVSVFTHW